MATGAILEAGHLAILKLGLDGLHVIRRHVPLCHRFRRLAQGRLDDARSDLVPLTVLSPGPYVPDQRHLEAKIGTQTLELPTNARHAQYELLAVTPNPAYSL